MLKLAVLFFVLTSVVGKLRDAVMDYDYSVEPLSVVEKGHLLVLEFDHSFEKVVFRKGKEQEYYDFDSVVGPPRETKKSSAHTKKKDELMSTPGNITNLRMDFFNALNMFLTSIIDEPEMDLTDYHTKDETPKIKIYIEDYRTVLEISSGRYQWNYVIGPPTLLPDWFYQQYHEFYDEETLQVPLNAFKSLIKSLTVVIKKVRSHVM